MENRKLYKIKQLLFYPLEQELWKFRKSKITKQKAKPEITYPLVRLPQSEMNIAGETAYVFKTEYKGKPVYVISLDEEFNVGAQGCTTWNKVWPRSKNWSIRKEALYALGIRK